MTDPNNTRSITRSLAVLFCSFFSVLLFAQTDHLVISQVYGGGGNTGAPYTNDYVVIFNPKGTDQLVTGWTIQYASSTGSTWSTVAISGTIAPGKYYLIQLASGGAVGSALPAPDATGTINMSGTAGKVALVSNATALSGTCPIGGAIVDFVGFGTTANCNETANAPAPSNTTAILRANGGCTDTNNNSTDFSTGAPTPRNSSTPTNYCGPTQLAIDAVFSPQTAGSPFAVTIRSVNASSVAKNVYVNTQVTLTSNGNAGAIGGTIVGTIPANSSSFTYTGVSFPTNGTNVTITATRDAGDALTSATSNTFDVNSAVANDCLGVPGGPDVPGTPCNDANACTINDTWDPGCNCVGTFQDSDGDGTCDANDGCPNDPNKTAPLACGCGNLEVGQACNDGNLCTTGDVITSCGVCAGTPLPDGDGDGTCDDQDGCPTDPNKIAPGVCGCGNPEPGTACNDGNAATINDQITAGCVCAGVFPSIYWDFGLVTGTDAATTNTVPNTTVGLMSRGNNNGTTNALITTTSASNYAGASGTNNAGAAARIGALSLAANATAYFEFTVTSAAGFAVTINQIKFGSRSTGTGPVAFTLRSSLDSYSSNLTTGTMLANSAWALHTSSAFAATSLPGGSITFRLFGHDGTGSPGANSTNWRIDDVNVYGISNAVANLPLVGFNTAVSSGNEDAGPVQIGVTMDSAPEAAVVVSVNDALTGTASAGDYGYTNSNLTYLPGDTYPYTQFVTISPVADAVFEPNETVVLNLALVSGSANLGFTTHTFTIINDDIPALVINEVDYDQPGTDTEEFVEIKNVGTIPVPLGGMKLVLQNGSGDVPYNTITLNSVSLAPGAYYVVGSAIVPNVNQVVWTSNGIQNGDPDGVKLTTAANAVIDQMSYGGAMSTTEGTTAPTDLGTTAGVSISRIPDGADSNNNSVDFKRNCSSPGAANVFLDTDGDGTPDCIDQCPGGPEPGAVCDDGNAGTGNDRIQSDCSCQGQVIDCLGVLNGPAVPGTPCIDGNPNTINDVYQPDCMCAGVLIDCLGTPGGPALPGTPCNDGNPATVYDVYDAGCACSGVPCTIDLSIDFQTDGTSGIRWEMRDQGTGRVIQNNIAWPDHVVLPGPGNYTDMTCLIAGCYYLQVYDDGGDGITGGGYVLRLNDGTRIIDNTNNFSNGTLSAIANNEGFCLPLGSDRLIYTRCDKMDWNVGPCDGSAPSTYKSEFMVANDNPLVTAAYPNAMSGYEFWFFDPNGGFSFRRFRSHSQGEGAPVAPNLRSTHCLLNNWSAANQLSQNVLYNVRVRGRINGSYNEFGPACRMKLDQTAAQCPVTKLMDIPNNPYLSCGQHRQWGNGNYVHALPVRRYNNNCRWVSANKYQWRFRTDGGGFEVIVNSTNYFRQLSWTNTPLAAGSTYMVDVRASFDGGATWCASGDNWGDVCLLTIDPPAIGGGQNMAAVGNGLDAPALRMFPNPNQGDRLTLMLDEVAEGVNTVSVDIYDLFGKRINTRTIAVNDGFVNTVIDLDGTLATGLYLVNITAGERTYTERLMIQD